MMDVNSGESQLTPTDQTGQDVSERDIHRDVSTESNCDQDTSDVTPKDHSNNSDQQKPHISSIPTNGVNNIFDSLSKYFPRSGSSVLLSGSCHEKISDGNHEARETNGHTCHKACQSSFREKVNDTSASLSDRQTGEQQLVKEGQQEKAAVRSLPLPLPADSLSVTAISPELGKDHMGASALNSNVPGSNGTEPISGQFYTATKHGINKGAIVYAAPSRIISENAKITIPASQSSQAGEEAARVVINLGDSNRCATPGKSVGSLMPVTSQDFQLGKTGDSSRNQQGAFQHLNTYPAYFTKQLSPVIPQTVLEHISDNDEPVNDASDTDTKKDLSQSDISSIGGNSLSNSGTAEALSRFKSDMCYSSDSEDRLVVDNNSRTDNSIDDESIPDRSVSVEGYKVKEQKDSSAVESNAQNADTLTISCTPNLSTSAKTETSEKLCYQPPMIPSVVSDLVPTTEAVTDSYLANPAVHGKKREIKSLPANFKPAKHEPFPSSVEDSLLKMNKPATGPSGHRQVGFPVHMTATQELGEMQKQLTASDLPSKQFDILKDENKFILSGVSQIQPTSAPDLVQSSLQTRFYKLCQHEAPGTDGKFGIQDSEGKMKKEKSAPESPDLSKDSMTSAEQVIAIIKKYNLLNSPEKREVSVKDMRRVIPHLIMCLYSKEDHHARKVKGLWEKKPDNWPNDIPYCDPNNSNRGDSTGKPKKETLHKMFDFLLHQYDKKRHTKDTSTLGIPQQPQDGSVPPYNFSMLSPVTGCYSEHYRPHVTVMSSHATIVGTTDLRPIFHSSASPELQHRVLVCHDSPETKQAKLTTSSNTGSLPSDLLMAFTSCKHDAAKPVRRQKRNCGEESIDNPKSKVQCINQLPTVVDMHSPVHMDQETDMDHAHESNNSKPLQQFPEVPNVPNIPSNALSNKDLSGHAGTSPNVQLPLKGRYASLPNVSLMVTHQGSSIHTANNTSSVGSDLNAASFKTSSGPKSSPLHSSLSFMLSVPLQCSSATSPLHHKTELSQYQSNSSLLSAQELHPGDSKATAAPAQLQDSSKHMHCTTPEVAECMNRKDPPLGHFKEKPQSSPSSVNHEGNKCSQLVDLSNVQPHVTEKQCVPPIYVTECKSGDGARFTGEYKGNDSIEQTQSADLQAASAILMLSSTPVVSGAEKTQNDKAQKPLEASFECSTEPRSECHSIDSDYHSSLRDKLYQVSVSHTSKKVTSPKVSTVGCSVSAEAILLRSPSFTSPAAYQHHLSVALAGNPGLLGSSHLIGSLPVSSVSSSTTSSAGNLLPSVMPSLNETTSASKAKGSNVVSTSKASLPYQVSSSMYPATNVCPTTESDQDIACSSQSTLNKVPISSMSLMSDQYSSIQPCLPTVDSSTDQREKQLPPQASTSDACSGNAPKAHFTTKEPAYDHPLSLVLPHRETSHIEQAALDVKAEDSADLIQETMSRIQRKMERIEKLHEAKEFGKRDFSLLLLVLDLLQQKQNSLESQHLVDFILTCHKLEATFDVALIKKQIPPMLREDWRDYQEKNFFEVVTRRRSSVMPPTDAPVFHLSTTQ